jgi:uncharacterized damage-inducible protein DinB
VTDEERRIRSYLQAQGAKLTPAEIIDKVRAALEQLRAAAAAIPPERFDQRPEPEEWSANDVMAHVVAAGRSVGDRIVAILDGLPAPEPVTAAREDHGEMLTAAEWSRRLERDRAALFARVVRAEPGAHLEERAEHGVFGALNWRELLLFLRLHDLDHAGQLQKIAAALAAPRPA